MTRSSNIKRPLGIGAAILLLVVIAVVTRNFLISRQTIGQFTVPALSGWTSETKRGPIEDIIFYQKTKLHITLRWHKLHSKNSPATIQDLEKEEVENQQSFASINSQFHLNTQYQQTVNQPTTLNGMTALLTQHILHQGSLNQVLYSKTLRFIDGKSYYTLSSYISMPENSSVPADMQAELDQAWSKVTDALRPTSP